MYYYFFSINSLRIILSTVNYYYIKIFVYFTPEIPRDVKFSLLKTYLGLNNKDRS